MEHAPNVKPEITEQLVRCLIGEIVMPPGLGADFYRSEWTEAVRCVANGLQCVGRVPTRESILEELSDPAAALALLNECLRAAPHSEDARMLQLFLHQFVRPGSHTLDVQRFRSLCDPFVSRHRYDRAAASSRH